MKIEGVSIQPVQPFSICNCRFGSGSNPFVLRPLLDQKLQSAFVGITGEDWELKYLKDIASLYELDTESKSVFVEASLTSQLIDRLSVSLTLEDKDAHVSQLRELLQQLEADRPACECTCT